MGRRAFPYKALIFIVVYCVAVALVVSFVIKYVAYCFSAGSILALIQLWVVLMVVGVPTRLASYFAGGAARELVDWFRGQQDSTTY